MYIEQKISGDDTGPARIGRVVFSKTGRTLYSAGKAFQSLKGSGIGGDYADVETGEEYWISERGRLGGFGETHRASNGGRFCGLSEHCTPA